MNEIKGFYINYTGDPTVGIQPSEWKIEGGFSFEGEKDLKVFKEKISNAFEYICGTEIFKQKDIKVETFEERDANFTKELRNSLVETTVNILDKEFVKNYMMGLSIYQKDRLKTLLTGLF